MKQIAFDVEDSQFEDASLNGGIGNESEHIKQRYFERCGQEEKNLADDKRRAMKEASVKNFIENLIVVKEKGSTEVKGAIENLEATVATESAKIKEEEALKAKESTPESVATQDQT